MRPRMRLRPKPMRPRPQNLAIGLKDLTSVVVVKIYQHLFSKGSGEDSSAVTMVVY